MKKYLFISLIFLITKADFAQSVERTGGRARVMSMGNNPFIFDPEFIKVNPAWMSYYNDFVWGDIGSNSGVKFGDESIGQFAGVDFNINRKLVLGALLSINNNQTTTDISNPDPGGLVTQINNMTGQGNVAGLNNNFEIMGAYRYGRCVFGLGIAYASSKNNWSSSFTGTRKGTASQFGINAGMLAHFNKRLTLDLGASFIFPSASYTPNAGFSTKLNQSIISISSRMFVKVNGKVEIIPIITYSTSFGTAENLGITGDLPTNNNLTAGIGAEYKFRRILLAGGVSFNYSKQKIPARQNITLEQINEITGFPIWNFGAEWRAVRWLVVRFGYSASTYNGSYQFAETTDANKQNDLTTYQPGRVTLGIGFRFGGFSLDATINSDVLREGLNNIGGGGATFNYISMSYAF